jgi:hypothetical protein
MNPVIISMHGLGLPEFNLSGSRSVDLGAANSDRNFESENNKSAMLKLQNCCASCCQVIESAPMSDIWAE